MGWGGVCEHRHASGFRIKGALWVCYVMFSWPSRSTSCSVCWRPWIWEMETSALWNHPSTARCCQATTLCMHGRFAWVAGISNANTTRRNTSARLMSWRSSTADVPKTFRAPCCQGMRKMCVSFRNQSHNYFESFAVNLGYLQSIKILNHHIAKYDNIENISVAPVFVVELSIQSTHA